MEICHPHNLNVAPPPTKRYGIRVSLPPGDTLAHLLGADWAQLHWFATPEERDRALEEMASEHLYSRTGDKPTLRFERAERPV